VVAPNAYVQAIAALSELFLQRVYEPYETVNSGSMNFETGEQVDVFVTRLRVQASFCNFADVNVEVRDRLIKVIPWPDLAKEIYKKAIYSFITLHREQGLTRIHQRVSIEPAGKF